MCLSSTTFQICLKDLHLKGKFDKIKTYASGIFKRKSDGTPNVGLDGCTLTPNEDSVEEPSNPTFANPHSPTILEEDSMHMPVKHNFQRYLKDLHLKEKLTK